MILMHYIIKSKVIEGEGYGRAIGFPTVNLETNNQDMPPPGVYAGVAQLDGVRYKAGIVIGPADKKAEAHLIGYAGDAYGKEAIINVAKFLRNFKKFKSEKELINQIKKDIKNVHRHN